MPARPSSAKPRAASKRPAHAAGGTTATKAMKGTNEAAPAGRAGGIRTPKVDLSTVLRQRIASHELPPGSKLAETDLAQEFGVPRTRVREALAVLEQRGLVERIPNRGAVVMRLEWSQVEQLYDLREVLEGLCARLATVNGPAARWKKSLAHFKGPMVQHVAAGDLDRYIADYEAFRRDMIEAAANPVLVQMLDSILERTQMLIRRIIILPGRAEQGLALHTAVLEAMCAGDADRAEALRRETMRSAKAVAARYQKYLL